MAAHEIKTTLKLEGEKEFKRALKEANQEMRLMGAELRQVASEFDLTGNEQQYYTRRAEILKKQVEQQKRIVAEFEQRLAAVAQKYGEASNEAQGMTIRLTNAQTKLNKLQKEFNDNEKAAKDFGKAVEKNVEKETKQAGKAVDDLKDNLGELDSELGGIRGSLEGLKNLNVLEVGLDIAGQLPEWISEIEGFAQEGRETKRQQVFSEYRAESAGLDPAAVEEIIRWVAARTGNYEEAREGIGILMQGRENLTVDRLNIEAQNITGLALKYPNLGFSSLAEGFQQSVVNREFDGQAVQVLEMTYPATGETGSVEYYRKQLEAQRNDADASDLLLTAFRGTGAIDFLAQFEREHPELIRAEDSFQNKERAQEELAATFSTSPIATGAAEITADVMNALTYAMKEPQQAAADILGAATDAFANALSFASQGTFDTAANLTHVLSGEEPATGGQGPVYWLQNLFEGFLLRRLVKSNPNWAEEHPELAEKYPEYANSWEGKVRPNRSPRAKGGESLWDEIAGEPAHDGTGLSPEEMSLLSDPALLSEETGRSLQEAAQNIATAYGDVMQQLGIGAQESRKAEREPYRPCRTWWTESTPPQMVSLFRL